MCPHPAWSSIDLGDGGLSSASAERPTLTSLNPVFLYYTVEALLVCRAQFSLTGAGEPGIVLIPVTLTLMVLPLEICLEGTCRGLFHVPPWPL